MSKTKFYLQAREIPKLLSIVIPIYNEQEVLPILQKRIEKFVKTLPCATELIFVNDGSADQSIFLLKEWSDKNTSVKVLNFSRNFGHQMAVTAGLDIAKGDAVVIMDADLQDPPEVIHKMLERYCEGYDVVYGQRRERKGESLFKKITAWGFYRVMRKLVHKDLPLDTGDFRLVSRHCLETLKQLKEVHRFLRGMVTWIGFPQIGVPFDRDARAAGETKYPLKKMIRFAWTAAISFSSVPLKFSLSAGLLVAFFGACAGVYAVISYLIFHFIHPAGFSYSPGWASLVTLICIIGGTILICIGVLGEYIGHIFEEIKARPIYIVSSTFNLKSDRHSNFSDGNTI